MHISICQAELGLNFDARQLLQQNRCAQREPLRSFAAVPHWIDTRADHDTIKRRQNTAQSILVDEQSVQRQSLRE